MGRYRTELGARRCLRRLVDAERQRRCHSPQWTLRVPALKAPGGTSAVRTATMIFSGLTDEHVSTVHEISNMTRSHLPGIRIFDHVIKFLVPPIG